MTAAVPPLADTVTSGHSATGGCTSKPSPATPVELSVTADDADQPSLTAPAATVGLTSPVLGREHRVTFDPEFPFNELFPPSPNPGAEAPEIELAGPDRPDDLQFTLQLVSDELLQHDTLALSRLTAEQRERQVHARRELWGVVLAYWEQAKADGLNPALRTEWQTVAGMIDLTQALLENASTAADVDE